MKELDILLERFISAHQETLENGAWPELEALLDTEDDVLWDWIQNAATPDASRYRELLKQIRRGKA